MPEPSDPTTITDAVAAAADAFNQAGHGIPEPEAGINTDADWKTQLTKACRLTQIVEVSVDEGYYTAGIELSFGIIERSLESFALREGGDELADFHDHTHCFDRASELGLLSRDVTQSLRTLYDSNRSESYYGDRRATKPQAIAMQSLATEIHHYVADQIREGGVCRCGTED